MNSLKSWKEENIKRIFLPNSSYEMSGEHQAMYFLHMRENMKTDIAYVIMHSGVDLRDVSFLRESRHD